MAASSQDIFGSDDSSDSDVEAPSNGLRISPVPKEMSTPTPKSGSEAGGDTPVVAEESDGDGEGDSSQQPAQHTSGFTRVPSDVEEDDPEEDSERANPKLEDGASEPQISSQEGAPKPDADVEDDEEIRIEAAMRRLEPNFDGRFFYWKQQDFLRAQTENFVADEYEDDFEDFEEDPPMETQQAIHQAVKNTMRWRWNTTEDGVRVPESNTKLVKWSDGSSSIVIGNEYYDISFIPLKGEHHQLFLRQGTGLQGGVVFKEKMTIRPAVANPLARKGRLTASGPAAVSGIKTDEKSRRTNYMNEVVAEDPEKKRQKQMKQEEDKLKATIKKETAQRRIKERHHNRGVTSGFLEGNEDEDETSIAAIKNAYKRGDYTRPVYSDDDDSEAEGRKKKLESAKDLDDSDEEDDFAVKKKKTDEGATKKRIALIKEDDESD
ncbi:putative RNA polymerase-associated protein LEO1 [Hypsibius exemplaris]|uniref:RNA polymerase-associated protein LEO1 n=1 Tax=Hypsibius exemplaris TaxID=2072580 RepID=A0A1W0WAX2_HYPEX|nr:putative RNA polymerase-associated protein LEO1 [Hypsibius exemplaris]